MLTLNAKFILRITGASLLVTGLPPLILPAAVILPFIFPKRPPAFDAEPAAATQASLTTRLLGASTITLGALCLNESVASYGPRQDFLKLLAVYGAVMAIQTGALIKSAGNKSTKQLTEPSTPDLQKQLQNQSTEPTTITSATATTDSLSDTTTTPLSSSQDHPTQAKVNVGIDSKTWTIAFLAFTALSVSSFIVYPDLDN